MLQMHKRGWPNQPKFWHGPGRKPAKGLCGNERGTGRSILAVLLRLDRTFFPPHAGQDGRCRSPKRTPLQLRPIRRADRAPRHASYRAARREQNRVAVLALNTTDTLEVQFACGRLGAIFVPLNIRLNVPELEFIVGDAAPKVMVHDTDLADTALAVAKAC